jgi:hypothetical protein
LRPLASPGHQWLGSARVQAGSSASETRMAQQRDRPISGPSATCCHGESGRRTITSEHQLHANCPRRVCAGTLTMTRERARGRSHRRPAPYSSPIEGQQQEQQLVRPRAAGRPRVLACRRLWRARVGVVSPPLDNTMPAGLGARRGSRGVSAGQAVWDKTNETAPERLDLCKPQRRTFRWASRSGRPTAPRLEFGRACSRRARVIDSGLPNEASIALAWARSDCAELARGPSCC